MFHLHYDTRLEVLADRLAALLAQPDPAHLLRPQTVLVPQAGLQRWLVQRLAERHGIAANLEFTAPAQLVWRVLRANHAGLPALSAFDRDVLVWRLLALLAADDLPPALEALTCGEPSASRRFELAGHLARLYERYQAYRRPMLEQWQLGAGHDDPQAELWRRLTAIDEPSRSQLLGDFLARYTAADAAPPAGLPARLFAFGTINVSPDVLRVLGVLGRHVELHFFMPTPCREYWGDVPDRRDLKARLDEFGGTGFDEPPNPLLVSLGGVGRDFVAQLFAYDEVQPDFENTDDDAEPARATLLQCVQADVITLAAPDPAARFGFCDQADRSLHVHVCHSPLREVQVLHDQLLDMLEHDPHLQPRDIAVMVPDIALYAPCVEAVFGALAWDDPRRIPWTLADRPTAQSHALVAMFLDLLDLPTSRLGVASVLDVLAIPAVSRRHDLDASDLERLAAWVQGAGVRWGEDAADRVAHGLPAFEEYSWRFGRRRLLLGYMSGDTAAGQLLHGVAPLTDLEGADAVALGALFAVQRELLQLRAELRIPRTTDAWLALFNAVFERLLAPAQDGDEERALDAIRVALKAMAQQAAAAGHADAIDWTTVRACIREKLQDNPSQQRFLAGGVSVCGLVPLRSVPFKVICVLGLDAESFPRRDPDDALNRVHADRIAGRRQPGDRAIRDDDRYLFLQTLMAARDALYLSYTGIALRDGKPREPSALLSELLDVVCTEYFADAVAARQSLVTRHPMQPFSQRLFVPDAANPQVFTYRQEWRAAAQPGPASPSAPFVDVEWPVEQPERVLELSELRSFLRNPASAFFRQQARLGLVGGADAADPREPLALDRLQQYQLDTALVDFARDSAEALPDALPAMRAQALLPPLDWGRREFDDTLQQIGPVLRRWRDWQDAYTPLPARRFRLELEGGRVLQGVLDDVCVGAYAGWVGNSHSAARLLSWWVGALVMTALEGDIPCVAWGRNRRDDRLRLPLRARMPTPMEARERLGELLDIHAQGQISPLPLPPRTAFTYAQAVLAGRPDRVLPLAEATWKGGFKRYGECMDRWFELAFRGRELFDAGAMQERFEVLAGGVYIPMCLALENGVLP